MVVQGSTPWAGVVEGIDGVKEALLQVLWKDPGEAALEAVASLLSSLEEPAAWARHGSGDGRPYWHCWFGYERGSVTIQRLTVPLQSEVAMRRLRSTLGEITGVLADCAEELRQLTNAAARAGAFTPRHPGQGSA
ncbi:hypothetical protein [Roseicella aerolata]|uniref:Uncharacterized protein n=1 Tax=Roseicella aerolata TaxID=2883479 RepID=A0A9X1IIE4_9PROT|nr:hypothetical protein [Roseicella aerolata]MCB4823948.1 hypothetical protein [Roseicella aerolata]